MTRQRRKTPTCPKCNRNNTYDIIPEIPNEPEIQINPYQCMVEYVETYTIGNAKYYCMDCHHTWKKYRGRKPYNMVRKIYASSGGFPGPYFDVTIELDKEEVIDWFLEELYKCDFLNWAEEYIQPYVLDGGHWSVRIEYDTYCEIKMGSNHYPVKWAKFCKAVSAISGSEFY
ncbi:hypothetical protein SAMN05880501_102160 [Ureibacillus xyleni]|uniref:Uncharacterized protein n=1 Tax=Ureibacillus xyleni TaxID=614648 RepID=A0A285S296_9BACL|nr:hypothetical protein [Ureibacillus xyleni]SOB99173.1 hypothetical protein SAMN05880501_102160 [Ureibacillus xyleni]